MNDRLLMACVLTLVACGPLPEPASPPIPEATPEAMARPDQAVDASVPFVEVVFPARKETFLEEPIYARLDRGTATFSSERELALGEEYPAFVRLTPTGLTYVASAECTYQTRPAAVWTSVLSISGDAAALMFAPNGSGVLGVTLVHEGSVTVVLKGEVRGITCTVDGVATKTLPLVHTVTLRVQRVAGFVVEHDSRFGEGCAGERLVMPVGADVSVPAPFPLDGTGRRFVAANAPTAVGLTLRTQNDVAVTPQTWRLSRPGQVEVVLATRLPVRGVHVFEVVGPESVQAVDAALYLTLEAAKGSVSVPLQSGRSYGVYFPNRANTVELRIDSVMTKPGPLCHAMPSTWLVATSSTPTQCPVATSGWGYAGGVLVASVIAAGECRLDVTLPGTDLHWAATFSTNR